MKTKEQRKLEIIQLYNEEKEALDNEYESDKSDLLRWKKESLKEINKEEKL